jgi:3-oxoacyl-[acyl-carrier-protein] synthase-3
MASCSILHVRLAGIACAVPDKIRSLDDDVLAFGEADALKISSSTGVKQRYVAPPGVCTSDLCFASAKQILEELDWAPDSIDVLIFVSQTPDYVLPATACSLHGRLGLAKRCASFDLNLGCSGYVYGLWVAASLLSAGSYSRALLLVGDTISRLASPQDRSVAPLFGDAGTATALERSASAPPMYFELGTDGAGQSHLVVPAGGFRQPHSAETALRVERENGNVRSDEDLYMNGPEIFTFTLREVQPLVQSTLAAANWRVEDVDAFVFHQANQFMLTHLSKRMKLPAGKVVLALGEYGNTSSASIPLAILHGLRDRARTGPLQLLIAGFGVGFSWGAAALKVDKLVMPKLLKVRGC